ncbi:hypothetical protein CALCODRAFT_225840 [Calocera cornea HHB12733]|uniref:Uncharacterized protein n=1 Tax=Calocera cornea HHB12733 TaxID=1353952 RepID=A0A165C0R4_9BASI|nr:hypothetical protein CALCODRAFT_225840 [Calocera cornea HHB12733]
MGEQPQAGSLPLDLLHNSPLARLSQYPGCLACASSHRRFATSTSVHWNACNSHFHPRCPVTVQDGQLWCLSRFQRDALYECTNMQHFRLSWDWGPSAAHAEVLSLDSHDLRAMATGWPSLASLVCGPLSVDDPGRPRSRAIEWSAIVEIVASWTTLRHLRLDHVDFGQPPPPQQAFWHCPAYRSTSVLQGCCAQDGTRRGHRHVVGRSRLCI